MSEGRVLRRLIKLSCVSHNTSSAGSEIVLQVRAQSSTKRCGRCHVNICLVTSLTSSSISKIWCILGELWSPSHMSVFGSGAPQAGQTEARSGGPPTASALRTSGVDIWMDNACGRDP